MKRVSPFIPLFCLVFLLSGKTIIAGSIPAVASYKSSIDRDGASKTSA